MANKTKRQAVALQRKVREERSLKSFEELDNNLAHQVKQFHKFFYWPNDDPIGVPYYPFP